MHHSLLFTLLLWIASTDIHKICIIETRICMYFHKRSTTRRNMDLRNISVYIHTTQHARAQVYWHWATIGGWCIYTYTNRYMNERANYAPLACCVYVYIPLSECHLIPLQQQLYSRAITEQQPSRGAHFHLAKKNVSSRSTKYCAAAAAQETLRSRDTRVYVWSISARDAGNFPVSIDVKSQTRFIIAF